MGGGGGEGGSLFRISIKKRTSFYSKENEDKKGYQLRQHGCDKPQDQRGEGGVTVTSL